MADMLEQQLIFQQQFIITMHLIPLIWAADFIFLKQEVTMELKEHLRFNKFLIGAAFIFFWSCTNAVKNEQDTKQSQASVSA